MTVKAELESLEGLPEPVAKEYKAIDRAGKKVFVLDLEGELPEEMAAPLKRARDHEKKTRQEVEKKATELEAARVKLQEEIDEMRRGNIPKDDVAKLEKSWKDKLDKREAELTGDRDSALGTVKKLLVDNQAQAIATRISNSPHLILPHIKARLMAEKTSDGYVTRVLDAEGKPTADSLEDLEKQFKADKDFAAVILGSKASGAGASGANGGGKGATSHGVDWSKADPNKLSPKDKVEWVKWKRESRGAT